MNDAPQMNADHEGSADQTSRDNVEAALASTVERLRADGEPWWPGLEIAPVAYRRLSSFSRRNQSKHPTDEHRILDLAKGLQAHFEPDVPYTHMNDWRHLSLELLTVFVERVEGEFNN